MEQLTGTVVRPQRRTVLPMRLERTTLRTLRDRDASSLHWVFHEEVQRYLPNAPRTPEHLARYTAWVERQSGIARQLSLAVAIGDKPIGIIQGWALEPTAKTIEWGFALARPRWGHGLFHESGRAFLALAVEHLGVERIEARTPLANERAIAALRRLGARCEGVIPRGLADKETDCFLWSILAADVEGIVARTRKPTGY
jgi:ribosomal-protein-alanine N-acetyltransferase